MIIITKTTVAARPVSLEQKAMAIARKRLRFKTNCRCHNDCISTKITNRTNRTNSNQINSLSLKNMDQHRHFIVIGLIGLVLLINGSTFVAAASRNVPRSASIAGNDDTNQRLIHNNWFEFQRQSLNQRTQYQAQDFSNIFTQLGIFIQSRQRNASELAGKIFFKYYNT